MKFDSSLIRDYEDMLAIVKTKKEQILDSRPFTHPSVINRKTALFFKKYAIVLMGLNLFLWRHVCFTAQQVCL